MLIFYACRRRWRRLSKPTALNWYDRRPQPRPSSGSGSGTGSQSDTIVWVWEWDWVTVWHCQMSVDTVTVAVPVRMSDSDYLSWSWTWTDSVSVTDADCCDVVSGRTLGAKTSTPITYWSDCCQTDSTKAGPGTLPPRNVKRDKYRLIKNQQLAQFISRNDKLWRFSISDSLPIFCQRKILTSQREVQ